MREPLQADSNPFPHFDHIVDDAVLVVGLALGALAAGASMLVGGVIWRLRHR